METIHESESHKEDSNKEIHTCNVCGKNFSYNSSLIKHVRIHTGERPYTCSFQGCLQKFSQVSNLIRHKRIHSGVKPYKCNYCNKNFSSSSNLKQHLNVHKNVIKRKKFPCFIQKCDKSYLYICTLKKHILNSHMEEYQQLKAEFPDRTFYDIFKELRTNNKFPFVDFKFFDSTNDLTNNQENIYDFNLENNINLNPKFKFEENNSLFLNLAAEQASGKLAFNSLAGGLNNFVNANNEIFNLNNLLCNLKTRENMSLENNFPAALQGNLNSDSLKIMNDLNAYLSLIQLQQAQQNSQIAQNQNQNLLLQSLFQAFNLSNPLAAVAANGIANNQINSNLTNLLTAAAASNTNSSCSSGSINNLNFLSQLNNLGNVPNIASGIQNNFTAGSLNTLNNLSNMQNFPQSAEIPNILNLSQKFMNTMNSNQNNINNNNNISNCNNSPFPNFGEMIKSNNNNNSSNNVNNFQACNGILSNLPCLGSLSKINFNNPNQNYQNFILENKQKADILKTTLNNNDIMNNLTNMNQSYLSELNSMRDQQNINDFINKYSNLNQIGLENTYSQAYHTFPNSQMSSTNINYK